MTILMHIHTGSTDTLDNWIIDLKEEYRDNLDMLEYAYGTEPFLDSEENYISHALKTWFSPV